MKSAIEEMKDSMRRVNHVDDLVHMTDSPFVASITSHPLPSKFKMPALDSYDRTCDPFDHIARSRQPCIFKVFWIKLCAESFLQL